MPYAVREKKETTGEVMQPNDLSALERLLGDWADFMHRGGSTTDGMPRKCPMAPDARIQSIEDIEIEVDMAVMTAISTSVYDLNSPERNCIMRRFGLMADVWRLANEQAVYDFAILNLHKMLRKKIVV